MLPACTTAARTPEAFMTSSVNLPAVRRRLRTLVHAVVANDAGDAQPIIPEQLTAALCLRAPVLGERAPPPDRVLVAKEREREDLPRIGDALKTLDRNEAVDLLEQRFQLGREVEIGFLPAIRGPDFEDDGNHAGS